MLSRFLPFMYRTLKIPVRGVFLNSLKTVLILILVLMILVMIWLLKFLMTVVGLVLMLNWRKFTMMFLVNNVLMILIRNVRLVIVLVILFLLVHLVLVLLLLIWLLLRNVLCRVRMRIVKWLRFVFLVWLVSNMCKIVLLILLKLMLRVMKKLLRVVRILLSGICGLPLLKFYGCVIIFGNILLLMLVIKWLRLMVLIFGPRLMNILILNLFLILYCVILIIPNRVVVMSLVICRVMLISNLLLCRNVLKMLKCSRVLRKTVVFGRFRINLRKFLRVFD